MSAVSGFCKKCNDFRKRYCSGDRNTCMTILFDRIEVLQHENNVAIERAIEAEALNRELVEALKRAHEYIGGINSFYGQGLQVYGWHLNGAPEPFDNFIDSNGGCEAEEFVGRVLTKAKEALGGE